MKLYAKRDTEDLGDRYIRHVEAMTVEGLHEKSDIAAELAWRDAEIDRLRNAVTLASILLNAPYAATSERREA